MVKKNKITQSGLNKSSISKKVIRYIFFSVLLLAILLTILAGVTHAYYQSIIKDKDILVNNNNTGLLLLDSKGDPFFSFYNSKRRKYTKLSDISPYVQKAAVTSEDKEFYQHEGISIRGILRAANVDLQNQSFAYGGSTITQQLVKNVLLTPEKSLIRKYKEAILANQIEKRYSKEEIMEMYLNSIYFGEGSFGIEDAAKTHFGKKAKDLTISESSFLISILPSPSRLSPYTGDREEAIERQQKLLTDMRKFGIITKEEFENAKKEVLNFQNHNEDANNIAPHFALMVRDELVKKYGEEKIIRSGYKVKTTLNIDFQEYAEVVVKNQVEKLSNNQVSNGAAIAIDPKTGEVKSLVGSADWSDEKSGKVNMVISPRQPGSSFKPFAYAKALDEKIITPATVLRDVKTTFKVQGCPSCDYTPGNYDGEYHGNILVRNALANSYNIPAVAVMEKVGVAKMLETAKKLGINSLNKPSGNYGLSLVLGAGEVSLMQMSEAYSAFANKGERNELRFYTEINDKKEDSIFNSKNNSIRVWPENVAFLISSILSDNNARKQEFGDALNTSRPAAVKTGTTDSYKDAWTIGYTPDVVVGVWVGNNDNAPMDKIAGSLGAAPIWRDLIEKYSEGKEVKNFEKPAEIEELSICRSSGLKAKNSSRNTFTEFFIPGTEPTKECNDEPKPTNKPDNAKKDEKEGTVDQGNTGDDGRGRGRGKKR